MTARAYAPEDDAAILVLEDGRDLILPMGGVAGTFCKAEALARLAQAAIISGALQPDGALAEDWTDRLRVYLTQMKGHYLITGHPILSKHG